MVLKKNIITSIDSPPSNPCYTGPDPGTYDVIFCVFQCRLHRFFSVCGCIPFPMYTPRLPTCDPFVLGRPDCERIATADLSNSSLERECKAECPPPCVHVDHSADHTASAFDPRLLVRVWGNESMAQHILHHKADIALIYAEMEYSQVDQYLLMGFFTAVSYLGGLLGLFCGASVLTFVHILVFCCSRCLEKENETKTSRNEEFDSKL